MQTNMETGAVTRIRMPQVAGQTTEFICKRARSQFITLVIFLGAAPGLMFLGAPLTLWAGAYIVLAIARLWIERYGRTWVRRRCCGRQKVSEEFLVQAEHARMARSLEMRMSGVFLSHSGNSWAVAAWEHSVAL